MLLSDIFIHLFCRGIMQFSNLHLSVLKSNKLNELKSTFREFN